MSKQREQQKVQEIILESISDGVFTVDHQWHITSFNRAAEKITGTSRKEALGRHCWEVFRSNMCEHDCALKRTMKEGRPLVSSDTTIIDNRQKRIPITVSTSLLKDVQGKILGGVEVFRDASLVEELRREMRDGSELAGMISINKEMQDMFRILPEVAASDATILIEGETGTGKELLAKALHQLSARKNQPFQALNCAALPDSLLESELFGYRAGAFTGANQDKAGLFAAAGEGTVFLDELGETSPAFQVRLLRVLEDRLFTPLGATDSRQMKARIVVATNRNLAAMVAAGQFRQDLYYRVNVVRFPLPPLRQRREDIPLLVDRLVAKLNHVRKKSISGLSDAAMQILLTHPFPGNIRELKNILEHAFILCQGPEIQPAHLPQDLVATAPPAEGSGQARQLVNATEKELILRTLRDNHYNRLQTAKALGIHKSTLFRKMHRLGIDLAELSPSSKG